jgi:hypothetical protein
MQPKRRYPEEMMTEYDKKNDLVYYSMREIVVDEIFSSWLNKHDDVGCWLGRMISLKDDVYDESTPEQPIFSGPYDYSNDGYPIDEETFLRRGWVVSMNPVHDWERAEARRTA